MKKHLTWTVVLGILVSCSNTKIKKPDNLISQNQMVDVIVDLTLLNSAQGLNKSILDDKGISPEAFIYKKYDIDSLQFFKSNEYYAHNIDAYEEMYVQIKARLEQEKIKYKKMGDQEAKEKKRLDSLRRIKNRANKISKEQYDKLKNIKSPLKINDSLPE